MTDRTEKIQGIVVDVSKKSEDLVSLVIRKDDETRVDASLPMSIKHETDLIPIKAALVGQSVDYKFNSAYDDRGGDSRYTLEILSGPAKGTYTTVTGWGF